MFKINTELKNLFEKLYFHEIDARDKIESRLKLPFGILAVVIGSITYMIDKKIIPTSDSLVLMFGILLASSMLSLVVSCYFFIRSWHGYTYQLIPTAKSIDNHIKATFELYTIESPGNAENWTMEELNDALLSYYRDFSTWNMENNDTKSKYLERTIHWLIISFLLTIASYFPFIIENALKGL